MLALVLMVVFLLRLENLKTKHGVPALQVLQAFLKTWVGHEPDDLERYFSNYAKNESVVTDVVLAESKETESRLCPARAYIPARSSRSGATTSPN